MKENFNYEIFCDMDGVLVDFEDAAVNKINKALSKENPPLKRLADRVKEDLGRDFVTISDLERNSPTKSRAAANYMYRLLEDDEDFWANLEWMPNGKELWDSISNSNFKPYILTTPMKKAGSMLGKFKWVQKNIGLDNVQGFILSKSKYKYAEGEDPSKVHVLIDDFIQNIEPWIEHGGVGLIYSFNKIEDVLKKIHQLKRLVEQQ